MARRASVRYWESRGAYCCWFKGKQTVLAEGPDDFPGPTYQAALDKFQQLTSLSHADHAKDQNPIRVVCERYLRWLSTRRHQTTLRLRHHLLLPFVEAFGDVTVSQLTQSIVYEWLDRMQQDRPAPKTGRPTRWSRGTIAIACTSLQAAFNWAAKTGLITKNPLIGLEQPPLRSRGREALIGRTPEGRT